MIKKLMAAAAIAGAFLATASAQAGTVLDGIRSRGQLVCGVRGDTQGFAKRDSQGRYRGFEVDLCRGIATAILGSADKVRFVSLEVTQRLPALQSKEVDVLVAGLTQTMTREVSLELDFPAIYYFDGQGFILPRKLRKRSVRDLDGVSICVQAGTTTLDAAAEFFQANRMAFRPVTFDNVDTMRTAFFAGQCDAMTADRSAVFSARATYASNPRDYLVVPEIISREPLGLVVRRDDLAFTDIVRWAFYALVAAEELGITAANAEEMRTSEASPPAVRRLLGTVAGIGKPFGLPESWAFTMIRQVGNYGEIFSRNVGNGSELRIPRGLNALVTGGGMQYAPPFR